MDSKTTNLYDLEEFNTAFVETTLREVSEALKEKGYDPINQLTGYLMSGDPGYISSHNNARKKITSIDRSKIIESLLKKGLN
ncbi:MAG: IreB family regulatory phosphoprotein [Firmicutes bacterium]|nr:IreB family regulatory phosphoprotein [Bacillota bacterium]